MIYSFLHKDFLGESVSWLAQKRISGNSVSWFAQKQNSGEFHIVMCPKAKSLKTYIVIRSMRIAGNSTSWFTQKRISGKSHIVICPKSKILENSTLWFAPKRISGFFYIVICSKGNFWNFWHRELLKRLSVDNLHCDSLKSAILGNPTPWFTQKMISENSTSLFARDNLEWLLGS